MIIVRINNTKCIRFRSMQLVFLSDIPAWCGDLMTATSSIYNDFIGISYEYQYDVTDNVSVVHRRRILSFFI